MSRLGGQSVARTHSPPAGAPPVGAAIMDALEHSVQRQGNIQARGAQDACSGSRHVHSRLPGQCRLPGCRQVPAWAPRLRQAAPLSHPQVCTSAKVAGLVPLGSAAWSVRTVGQCQQQGQGQEEHAVHAVVLATGGFAASQELLKLYAPRAAGLGTTNGAFAGGEGLELGTQAGKWRARRGCAVLPDVAREG